MKFNFNWKKIIFAISICMLFIPMVFLGVNTFYPFDDYSDCWAKTARAPGVDCYQYSLKNQTEQYNQCIANEDKVQKETRECEENFNAARRENEGLKYITVMIICIIASFVMLLNLDKSIIYGLFLGVVITAFSATIRYMDSRSKIGFMLMVTLFALMIFFVQRERSIKSA